MLSASILPQDVVHIMDEARPSTGGYEYIANLEISEEAAVREQLSFDGNPQFAKCHRSENIVRTGKAYQTTT